MRIVPEPDGVDRAVIDATVAEMRRIAEERAAFPVWRRAGLINTRSGVSDLNMGWRLASLFPAGGRPYTSLTGRGDQR